MRAKSKALTADKKAHVVSYRRHTLSPALPQGGGRSMHREYRTPHRLPTGYAQGYALKSTGTKPMLRPRGVGARRKSLEEKRHHALGPGRYGTFCPRSP